LIGPWQQCIANRDFERAPEDALIHFGVSQLRRVRTSLSFLPAKATEHWRSTAQQGTNLCLLLFTALFFLNVSSSRMHRLLSSTLLHPFSSLDSTLIPITSLLSDSSNSSCLTPRLQLDNHLLL